MKANKEKERTLLVFLLTLIILINGLLAISSDLSISHGIIKKSNSIENSLLNDEWSELFHFSGFFGGTGYDIGSDVVFDSEGNFIITGKTHSTDFPTLNAYNSTLQGGWDVIVAKFSSNGVPLWSTYIGGSLDDKGTAITIDRDNNIIITGETFSSDYPAKNAYDSSFNGNQDVFITKFSPTGSLIWSTFLGGASSEQTAGNRMGLNVDSKNNIILTGHTFSSSFPTSNAYDSKKDGGNDIFVTKFSSEGKLVWSTFIGGEEYYGDLASDICTDIDDNIIITGQTDSSDFPTLHAYDSTKDGEIEDCDAFISKFSSNGSLIWSSFLGGNGGDVGTAIEADLRNNLIVIGVTYSTNFPTLNAYDPEYSRYNDAFISKFSPDGLLIWSTYLGGTSNTGETASDLTIMSQNEILITGFTDSDNFPILDQLGPMTLENFNGFLTMFSSSGSLEFSSYIGGSLDDWFNAIEVDEQGNVIIIGDTDSDDFPIINHNTTTQGSHDIFLCYLKLDSDGDLIPNYWEELMGLNVTDPTDAELDKDNDDLSNLHEYQHGLNATNSDTDKDGLSDGYEVSNGLDPLTPNTSTNLTTSYNIKTSTSTTPPTNYKVKTSTQTPVVQITPLNNFLFLLSTVIIVIFYHSRRRND